MKQLITSFLVITALGITACSQADAPQTQSSKAVNAVETKTKAVLIYADWCGSCKILDPKLKEARGLGAIPGLDYVVLDYSAKDPADFYAQAEAAGVGAAVTAYLNGTIKTGQLVLVDMDDQKVLKKIDKTYEVPQMISAFKEAIAAS